MDGRRPLGDLLVASSLASREQVSQALGLQAQPDGARRRLGNLAVEMGWLSCEDLALTLARQFGLPFADPRGIEIDPAVAEAIPIATAERLRVLPLAFEDGEIVLAVTDPTNLVALDDVRIMSGRSVRPVVTTEQGVLDGLARLRQLDPALDGL